MAITIVGDAMARPLIEALDDEGASYDLSGLYVVGSGGAMLSPAVKERIAERLPNVIVVGQHRRVGDRVPGDVRGRRRRRPPPLRHGRAHDRAR